MATGIAGGIWLAVAGIYAVQSPLLTLLTIPRSYLTGPTIPDIPLWTRDPEAAALVVLLSVLAGAVIVALTCAARALQTPPPVIGLWVLGVALLLAAYAPSVMTALLVPHHSAALALEDLLKGPATLVSLAATTASIVLFHQRMCLG
jgi:hypothetical protein